MVVALVAVGAVVLLRGGGDGDDRATARAEAEAFLDAWAAGELRRAADRTDDPEAALSLLESVQQNTRPERLAFTVAEDAGEELSEDGGQEGGMAVPFTATFTLDGVGEWSYDSTARVLPPGDGGDGSWTVDWSSSLVHPRLEEGQTLVLTTEEPERAPILAADGSELAGPGTVWHLTIWPAQLSDPDAAYAAIERLDVGVDTERLADEVEAADPDQAVPVVTLRDETFQEHAADLQAVAGLQFDEDSQPLAYAAPALVGGVDAGTGEGTSGLQSRYEEQLAGMAAAAVVIADRESGDAVRTLFEREESEPGTPVETTIDPAVQAAAAEALEGLDQDAAIVAVQPSTGHVLAAADWPADGFNLSLQGQMAPGSTFKIVSTAALLEGGTADSDILGCPQFVTVDGQTFENQNQFELGPETTLREAFTASCNTAFIDNRDRFADDTLTETARAFGIGEEWTVGAVTFDGGVPVAENENELAASLIGQGRVQASPLVMASVAATVAEGAFHQPVLVPGAVEEPHQATAELGQETYEALRSLMRETVTSGSASALDGVPGEPHGKTGTAEFTDEEGELSTNAWMVGFLGERDLAFAVVLTGGGSGGADAGPVAADFLRGLG
ncbi:penicillin-binding transpeptidase domain-containing protein [Streptomyces sp. 4N509B]|uniref:penicillin-binding transpeptidase domain-containing protein n=1 Tax=Streptomyces sp. 4N509B TaxID=3457413 RepID=UPI003FD54506